MLLEEKVVLRRSKLRCCAAFGQNRTTGIPNVRFGWLRVEILLKNCSRLDRAAFPPFSEIPCTLPPTHRADGATFGLAEPIRR